MFLFIYILALVNKSWNNAIAFKTKSIQDFRIRLEGDLKI